MKDVKRERGEAVEWKEKIGRRSKDATAKIVDPCMIA